MLNKVAETIKRLSDATTLRYPNSFDVSVYRKVINREEPKELGGARVLSYDDEPEYTYNELGDGKMIKLDDYLPSGLTDNSAAFDYAEPSFYALILSNAKPNTDGYFVAKKGDMVYMILGEDLAIAYEITGSQGTIGVSPYGSRYELTKRDDADHSVNKENQGQP